MMKPDPIQVAAQVTPNPNSLQFMVSKEMIKEGSYHFKNAAAAKDSKLAEAIFQQGKIETVLIGRGFLTVTKLADADWPTLVPKVVETIKTFLATDQNIVEPNAIKQKQAKGSDVEEQIKTILNEEIRPAVARDGGDIIFDSYKDGIVKLHLQGACSSCPSSVMTLKMGVENRLKQAIPEIKEVIQA